MTRQEFIERWHTDSNFRMKMRFKGIRVIQNNIFYHDRPISKGMLEFLARN